MTEKIGFAITTITKAVDFLHSRKINVQNVSRLAPVCVFQAGEIAQFQASPVIFEGTLYVRRATTRTLWMRAPARRSGSMSTSRTSLTPVTVARGAALYKGKVFRVTPDGHLLALDAKTRRAPLGHLDVRREQRLLAQRSSNCIPGQSIHRRGWGRLGCRWTHIRLRCEYRQNPLGV